MLLCDSHHITLSVLCRSTDHPLHSPQHSLSLTHTRQANPHYVESNRKLHLTCVGRVGRLSEQLRPQGGAAEWVGKYSERIAKPTGRTARWMVLCKGKRRYLNTLANTQIPSLLRLNAHKQFFALGSRGAAHRKGNYISDKVTEVLRGALDRTDEKYRISSQLKVEAQQFEVKGSTTKVSG